MINQLAETFTSAVSSFSDVFSSRFTETKLIVSCVEGEAVSPAGATLDEGTVVAGVDGLGDDDEAVEGGVVGEYVVKILKLLRIDSNISLALPLISRLIGFCDRTIVGAQECEMQATWTIIAPILFACIMVLW
jgi:hypothetical protein